MENNDIQVETLSQKVQDIRDKARSILRMAKINNLMVYKFNATKDIKFFEDNVKYTEKQLAIAKYDLAKLDPEHPDAENKTKICQEAIDSYTKKLENNTKKLTEYKEDADKQIKEYDEKITKWESGESKVSIDELNQLADEMIHKI
jgi:V8-like Glu-specific endopeptidase